MGDSTSSSLEHTWRADGVRHHILLRVLPLQCHDMLGPVGALRMSLYLAKRRAAEDDIDRDALQAKVGDASGQVMEVADAVGTLRWWNEGHAEPVQLEHCLSRCGALMRKAMSLRGHLLHLPDLPDLPALPEHASPESTPVVVKPADAGPPQFVRAPSAYYAFFGLLMHAMDSFTEPQETWLAVGRGEVTLRAAPRADPPAAAAALPPRGQALGFQPLAWLMEDIGWDLQREPEGWRLAWASESA